MSLMGPIEEYYNRRAPEFDQMYGREIPELRAAYDQIARELSTVFAGRRVLEVACGTGHWTQFAARTAEHITATDVAPNMLSLARAKGMPPSRIEFRQHNAYDLDSIPGEFDAGLANFWISHVPKSRLNDFLTGFHARIGSGAVVFMADNVFVPELGGDFEPGKAGADSHRVRTLSDGSTWRVVKNYYDIQQLLDMFEPVGRDLRIQIGRALWWLHYFVR